MAWIKKNQSENSSGFFSFDAALAIVIVLGVSAIASSTLFYGMSISAHSTSVSSSAATLGQIADYLVRLGGACDYHGQTVAHHCVSREKLLSVWNSDYSSARDFGFSTLSFHSDSPPLPQQGQICIRREVLEGHSPMHLWVCGVLP